MTAPDAQGNGAPQPFPAYQAGHQTPPPFPGAPAPQRAAGLAIAALVVGIAAFVFGWVPVFGAIVGVVAIVLAVLALRKQQSKGMAVTGIVLGAIAVITSITFAAGIGAIFSSASDAAKESSAIVASPTPAPAAAEDTESTEPSESAAPSEAAAAPSEEAEAPAADVPVEYTSALTKAETYAELMNMSKAGVYDQLTSEYGEQFSAEAAQYAVDTVDADWNANALAKAKSYQEDMSMSPAAIRDQLVSEYGEQFLPAEADYAMAHLND